MADRHLDLVTMAKGREGEGNAADKHRVEGYFEDRVKWSFANRDHAMGSIVNLFLERARLR